MKLIQSTRGQLLLQWVGCVLFTEGHITTGVEEWWISGAVLLVSVSFQEIILDMFVSLKSLSVKFELDFTVIGIKDMWLNLTVLDYL